MTQNHNTEVGGADALREAFDRAFAEAPVADGERSESFLGIRVGGDAHAVALAEVGGLFADRKIVPLPGAAELLGVAGLRGEIIPVYSLRALLGYAPAEEPARWLIYSGDEQAVAFAFDQFDGYARVIPSELSSVPGAAARGYIHATATIMGMRRSIISIRSIMNSITSRPMREC